MLHRVEAQEEKFKREGGWLFLETVASSQGTSAAAIRCAVPAVPSGSSKQWVQRSEYDGRMGGS